MDHETRKLLQDYNDEFIKFKRYMEDALENIDFDNLSSRVRTAISMGGVSRSGFENEAGPDGAYARMFAEFKNEQSAALAEFRAQAMKDYATVEMVAEYKKDLDGQADSLANIKATADANGAVITELAEWKGVFTGIDGEFEQLKNSVAGVQKKANDNGVAIEEFAAWKNNFTAENGDFDTVLSEIKNIKEAAETYAKQEELTTFKKETVENFTIAEQNAKEYTDGEIGKIGDRIITVESSVNTLSEATDKYALKSDVTEFTSTITQMFEDADDAAKDYAEAAKAEAISDTMAYAEAAQNAAESAASAAENAANAKLEEHKQSWLETAQEKAQELANTAKMDAEAYADDMYTLIQDSFTDVIKKSDAQGAYINLMAGTIIGSVDADGNLYDKDGKKIDADNISAKTASVILEAANSGKTEIKLDADLINFGENASVDAKGNLRVTRLYGNQFGEELDNYYAKVGSALGDFGIYTPNEKSADANPSVSNDCVWGYYQRNGNEAINFFTYGYNYFGVHVGEPTDENYQVAFPKGTWNFTSCNVITHGNWDFSNATIDFSNATITGFEGVSGVAVFG